MLMIDRVKLKAREARKKDNARFGGLRSAVLERDGYRCVVCGITQQEHVDTWKRSLTIDHINNIGRTVREPDNRLDNLQTLCLRCHGRKDGPKWMHPSAGLLIIEKDHPSFIEGGLFGSEISQV